MSLPIFLKPFKDLTEEDLNMILNDEFLFNLYIHCGVLDAETLEFNFNK